MLKRDIKRTASTRLMTLKAQAMEDQKLLESGSSRAQLARVGKLFYDAYNVVDAREFAETRRKGVGGQPLDIAYSSAYFGYLIFVFSQNSASRQAKELYQRYVGSISEERRGELPLPVLSALMIVKLREKEYHEVQECWDLSFQYARKNGQPIDFQNSSKSGGVLPLHQLALARPLSTQITSLTRQRKLDQLSMTIKEVEAAGFLLDNKNWNLYIQSLAISSKYKEAFALCEDKLMDGWEGWARLRWTEPQRNRLPLELRYQRIRTKPSHLRPLYHTFLSLAKVYLELQDRAAELAQGKNALDDIDTGCRRTVLAIKTMQRVNDNLQRKFLRR
jgi:pentatricopeptide repeat-containing protein PET309